MEIKYHSGFCDACEISVDRGIVWPVALEFVRADFEAAGVVAEVFGSPPGNAA